MNEEKISNDGKEDESREEVEISECDLCGIKLPITELQDNGGSDLVCENCM